MQYHTTILYLSSVDAALQMIQKDPCVSGQFVPPVNVYSSVICTIKSLYLLYTLDKGQMPQANHMYLMCLCFILYVSYSYFYHFVIGIDKWTKL